MAQAAVAEVVRRMAREKGLPNIPVEEIASHGRQKKESRIYGLEPYFRRKQFYILAEHENFLSEYQHFPRGILRDVLDALSFQRDVWERSFSHGPYINEDAMERHNKAIAKIKAAVGVHGGY